MQIPFLPHRVVALVSTAFAVSLLFVATVVQAAPPSVTVQDPTNVTGDTAVFNATVNPANLQTTVRFRWVPGSGTCSGGTEVFADQNPLPAGNTDVPVTARVTGLVRGTAYTICVTASNASGSAQQPKLFTSPNTPIVTTVGPSQLSATTAAILGVVNPFGTAATAWIRYSTTSPGAWCNDSFGTRAPAAGGTSIASGMTALPYTQAITGLTKDTTYYLCTIAQNAAGSSYGAVVTMKTPYPALDIDQNGVIDTNTDGLLVVRYLLGLRGEALIAGSVGTNAHRASAEAIELHIQSLTQ